MAKRQRLQKTRELLSWKQKSLRKTRIAELEAQLPETTDNGKKSKSADA
jgi:hypothetical protein